MQPLFLKKNTRSFEQSFQIRHAIVPHTYDIWHYHSELELLHILKSSGTRFIGDSIEHFSDGDLVLVGSNLPHVWKNEKVYYEDETLNAEVILTHFQEDFVGREFFNIPEMHKIKELFTLARQGIQVYGETRGQVSEKLKALVNKEDGARVLGLIDVLHTIAISKEFRLLSSVGFGKSFHSKKNDRINKVYDFILNNFTDEITLKDAAAVANMNTTAFCRFFKTSTQKTFTKFLNDIRIGYACKLLIYENRTIAATAYETGFNNLSYFNRVFKTSLGITPQEYQRKHGKIEEAKSV
ncbi:AraC family transcriptional regulator [Flexithrix dorotheae]|uniref:AraC family transcriptional regulator n=1 Tax=Flexithrix dorotheae TaxID=70993 RepID=UPI000363EEB1|nr:AraC family transcriptional regulator [Flexithrix dorotheae]